MNSTQKPSRWVGTLLTVGGIIGVIFWLIMLFYAFFLGGSPGPGYERTVPLLYVPIIALGFAGAIVGLVAGTKSKRGANVRKMVIIAALLGVAGSIPFFLLELTFMGFIALAFGVVFPVVYLLINKG